MTKAGITTANLFDSINKFAIGFEPILRSVESRHDINYPPYNMIEHRQNEVTIELAVAGFSKEELLVEQDANQLLISGDVLKKPETSHRYLHKGISSRSFRLNWTLAEYTEVTSVTMTDGILTIELVKNIPEEKRPKSFDIN